MRDKDLYAQILGIKSPWQVTDVELVVSESTVTVHVGRDVLPAVCKGVAGLRSTHASLASPGHVSVQNDAGSRGTPSEVRRARGGHDVSTVGGTWQWFHRLI